MLLIFFYIECLKVKVEFGNVICKKKKKDVMCVFGVIFSWFINIFVISNLVLKVICNG